MKNLLIPALTATLCLTAIPAAASTEYEASIRGCENAIGERLGLAQSEFRTRIKGVDSRSRYRDLDFSVSALDDANPVQGVRVSCRARRSGEVLAVNIDESSLPGAIAAQ